MSRISGAKSGAESLISAMKGALRLAQSLSRQVIEQMGFFDGFSSRAKADSAASQKRDDKADSWLGKTVFSRAMTGSRRWFRPKMAGVADLLERKWQRFGIFAGSALVVFARSVQFI